MLTKVCCHTEIRQHTTEVHQHTEACYRVGRPRPSLISFALAEVICMMAILVATIAGLQGSAGATPAVRSGSVEGKIVCSPTTGGLSLSLDSGSITVADALGDLMPHTDITVGRQLIRWGPGVSGSLLLSGYAPLDGLTLEADLGRFRYVQVQAARDAAAGRWLLAHRIEGHIAPGVLAGISEAVAVSGGFRLQLCHLIPGFPYYLAQHLILHDDRSQDRWTNILLGVDAIVTLTKDARAYAEVMADDFPAAPSAWGRVPRMVGGLIGVRLDAPFGCEGYQAVAEYVRIHNYVYSHKNPDNTYIIADGRLIGHPLGPDADALYLFVKRGGREADEAQSVTEVTATLGYERHGEGHPGRAWTPADGVAHEFLSGIVETRRIIGVTLRTGLDWGVQPRSPQTCFSQTRSPQTRAAVELSARIESIDNARHLAGTRALEAGVNLILRLEWLPLATP